jgi:transposase
VNRAGVTTKLHLALTAEEHVVEGMLTGGNVADITMADELTADVVGCYVVEDMGYDCDRHRRALEANNNIPVIPGRKNRKVVVLYDKTVYKLRRRIEMFFGRIKENRRLVVRYEKLDVTFLGFIALAIVHAFYL